MAIVSEKGWNLDDVIQYLRVHGGEVGLDNDKQVVIYSGLKEDSDGNLVVMGE
jgi:hypothetical protein